MEHNHGVSLGEWYDTVTFGEAVSLLKDAGATALWTKYLQRNHNSKNQVYLAADPSDLSFLPLGTPWANPSTSQKKKAKTNVIRIPLSWTWVSPEDLSEAPFADLCFYPQYPEVRLSGIIRGARGAQKELFSSGPRFQEPGRCLIIGVDERKPQSERTCFGLIVSPDSPAAHELGEAEWFTQNKLCAVPIAEDDGLTPLEVKLRALLGRRITPWRLLSDGTEVRPIKAPNSPGLTLEAELGVAENAIPGPDYGIWELKALKQRALDKRSSERITLFTPQPDTGWITKHSQTDFVLKYGHATEQDEAGEPIRYDFTTRDFALSPDLESNLPAMRLEGFTSAKEFDTEGMIALRDPSDGNLIAGWTFMKLLEHWQTKHSSVAYVPYVKVKTEKAFDVEYGPLLTLGIGTRFGLFLQAFHDGHVIYDPAYNIKRQPDGTWKAKSRSQFRISSKNIGAIYDYVHEIDISVDFSSLDGFTKLSM